MLYDILESLNFGSSAAEDEDRLEDFFIPTHAYKKVLKDEGDIILGMKGSGKSAIFKVLSKQREEGNTEVRDIFFIPSSNEDPKAIETAVISKINDFEGTDYSLLWKYYVCMRIRELVKSDPFFVDHNDFQQLYTKFSEEIWDPSLDSLKKYEVTYIRFLKELDAILKNHGKKIWIMIDRLDKFLDRPEQQKKRLTLLNDLFRAYMDLRGLTNISIKIFLRTDLYHQLSGIPDRDKLSDKKIILEWNKENIIELIFKRLVKLNPALGLSDLEQSDREQSDRDASQLAFYAVFDQKIERYSKSAYTPNWIFSHLTDGKGIITPRDVIVLCKYSKDRQVRLSSRRREETKITGKALTLAFKSEFSKYKTHDYLFNEFQNMKTYFERFRGASSKLTKDEILSKKVEKEDVISEILDTGFFKEISSDAPDAIANKITYEIAPMYWSELQITRYKSPKRIKINRP